MDLSGFLEVVERIGRAEAAAGRSAGSVTLVAISKGHPVEAIQHLYEAGHRDFGENRAQELAEKAELLPADIRWHFVGSLQTNKVRLIRQTTTLLHSLDRRSLAGAWAKGIGKPPAALIQVNVGEEEQKGGVKPAELEELAGYAVDIGLDIVGLMAIPPIGENPEDSRPYFARMRQLRDRIVDVHPGITALSMGMTDDFEVGIAEGASFIRVGRAIFGPRH